MSADSEARKLVQRLSDAAGDVAMEKESNENLDPYFDSEYLAWVKVKKAEGVSDITGAYADHLYCDHDFQQDMFGDWTYNITDDSTERIKILEEIKGCDRIFTVSCNRLIENAKD